MNSKYPRRYYIDLNKRILKRRIRELVPERMLNLIFRNREYASLNAANDLLLDRESNPWTSPNIWQDVKNYYIELEKPTVFEYGIGASSIEHAHNLISINGRYIGVETNPGWFWVVISTLIRKFSEIGLELRILREDAQPPNKHEFNISLHGTGVNVILKLRSRKDKYILALENSCDVVIIDGAYRKECVKKVLQTDYLRNGGLLVLMEAGRGSPGWWEGKLEGEDDYSKEVSELLRLGGKIMDGNGIDSWPSTNRKSPTPVSYFYPKEACFLIRSDHKPMRK